MYSLLQGGVHNNSSTQGKSVCLRARCTLLYLSDFPPATDADVSSFLPAAEQRRAPDKPRAHLTAKETRGELSILQWEDKNGLAFTIGDINYRNRSLVISTDGDYFVYSQVSFRGMGSSKCEFITHTVIKHETYPEPTSLLTSTKSICDVESPWFVANYLGAVFQLKKGDRLVVQVSNVAQVDFTTEHKTFFGAFLL